jgi:hypothetical protein
MEKLITFVDNVRIMMSLKNARTFDEIERLREYESKVNAFLGEEIEFKTPKYSRKNGK